MVIPETASKIQGHIATASKVFNIDPHKIWTTAIRYIQFLENGLNATDNINKLFQKVFNFRPESDDINEWLTDLKTKFSLPQIQTYTEIINESKQNAMYGRHVLNPLDLEGKTTLSAIAPGASIASTSTST